MPDSSIETTILFLPFGETTEHSFDVQLFENKIRVINKIKTDTIRHTLFIQSHSKLLLINKMNI